MSNGLQQTGRSTQHNSIPQLRRARKAQLKFIIQNGDALLKVRCGEKLLSAAKDMDSLPIEALTESRMVYIDGIYEKMMEGLGFPSYKGQKTKYGVRLK